MKPCFFCDIQKKVDTHVLFKTRNFVIRFDGFPVNPGHINVFTKKHVESFFDINISLYSELGLAIKRAKFILDKQFESDGYTLGINEGPASGRTIAHFHLHIIPRFLGDVSNPEGGVRNVVPKKSKYVASARRIPNNIKYLKK